MNSTIEAAEPCTLTNIFQHNEIVGLGPSPWDCRVTVTGDKIVSQSPNFCAVGSISFDTQGGTLTSSDPSAEEFTGVLLINSRNEIVNQFTRQSNGEFNGGIESMTWTVESQECFFMELHWSKVTEVRSSSWGWILLQDVHIGSLSNHFTKSNKITAAVFEHAGKLK